MSLPELRRYPRLAIDIETTGLDYDDRPVGIAVAAPGSNGSYYDDDAKKWYLRWGHEQGGNNCSLADIKEWAGVELTNMGQRKTFHHALFDMRMLAYENIANMGDDPWALGDVHDTIIMANLFNELEPSFSLDALAAKYAGQGKTGDQELWDHCAEHFGGKATRRAQGKNIWRAHGDVVETYACGDVIATGRLEERLNRELSNIADEDLRYVSTIEMALLPLLLKMHLVGVRVDLAKADTLQHQLQTEYGQLWTQWVNTFGEVNWNSTPQLAELFEANGWPIQYTDRGNPSLTKEFLAEQDHIAAEMILNGRHISKLKDTFIKRFVFDWADDHGIIHCLFHNIKTAYGGTVSGRFSSSRPNMQQIPARDEEVAPKIRGLYVPYYDHMRWAKIDYSQIEYRFLAHFAYAMGYPALAEAYATDPNMDFHQTVADMTDIPRRPAKTLNFSVIYGAGDNKVARSLGIPLSEAKAFLRQYATRMPAAKSTYNRVMKVANKHGHIRTWLGRYRRFKRSKYGGHRATHKALNALLQGSAADLIKLAMVRVAQVIDWETVMLHLTVHDELDFSYEPSDAGHAMLREVHEVMQDFTLETKNRGPSNVPVIADLEVGDDWGHCKETTL